MHEKILERIDNSEMKSYLLRVMDDLYMKDEKTYEEVEDMLYKQVFGCHFTDFTLKQALCEMINEDGTKGAKWSLDDTEQLARNVGFPINDTNKYDWNYVCNMMYSDYYGSVPNEPSVYGKMTKKFMEDKDGVSGKAYKYWSMQ